MIDLISTPAYPEPSNPAVICRWLATESPCNWRLLRHDWDIVTAASYGSGLLRLTVAAGTYTGQVGDVISVFNKSLNAMYVGTVQLGSGTTTIDTDIVFQSGFAPGDPALDPDRLITYLNDQTLHAGYYFEGRLTINGVLYSLTIIASPDSFGYADLDVSGILRIVAAISKTGDYTARIMAEPTKSGNFSLEYRECWYSSNESWTESEGVGSPPAPMVYYYAEAVRSEEQGTNLHQFVPDAVQDAPFFNSFDQPVYFRGLPFDLSFILPPLGVSPASDITVTIESFDSEGHSLQIYTELVSGTLLDGFLNSVNINTAAVHANANRITVEISTP
jgi:hypothetical protein